MFLVLATENPIEYEGTYPLPEAQLDRFLFKILVSYPSFDDELQVIGNWQAGFNARKLEAVNFNAIDDPAVIPQCRALVRDTKVEPGVQAYLLNLARRTREHPSLLWGASPRAAVSMLLASKALAAMRGRDFVTPDDARDITPGFAPPRPAALRSRDRGRHARFGSRRDCGLGRSAALMKSVSHRGHREHRGINAFSAFSVTSVAIYLYDFHCLFFILFALGVLPLLFVCGLRLGRAGCQMGTDRIMTWSCCSSPMSITNALKTSRRLK